MQPTFAWHGLRARVNLIKMFEVVKGANSAPDTLATAMDLGRKIGKISAPWPAMAAALPVSRQP